MNGSAQVVTGAEASRAGHDRSRLLAVAGLLAALQATTHTVLFLSAKPENNPHTAAIVAAMRATHFEVGVLGSRTYWDFYFGYGLIAVILAFLIASVLWTAARCADAAAQRRLITVSTAALAIHAAVIVKYFFLLPLLFDGLTVVVLALWLLPTVCTPARPDRPAAGP
jgi:hypothetical protein